MKAPLTAGQIALLAKHLAARTVRQPSGCWEIQGHALHSGHVQLAIGTPPKRVMRLRRIVSEPYARVRAHVFAWELANKQQVPTGKVVRHDCDNARCVNPKHLKLGTQAENIADSVAKGRFTRWHTTGRRLDGKVPNVHYAAEHFGHDEQTSVPSPTEGER